MDYKLYNKIFLCQSKIKKELTTSVIGVSMNPILKEGDKLTVTKCDDYEIGDILVYLYKQDELLVHRLLKKESNVYYCKGDNCYRLEDVTYDRIVGKVTKVNGCENIPSPEGIVEASYAIHKLLAKLKYNIPLLRTTEEFKKYEEKYLRRNNMTYQKNENFDFIQSDNDSLAVFDPETETVFFFDEVGIDILKVLETPHTIENLINELCKIYDATPEDISDDVNEFIKDTLEKKVVIKK